MAMKAEHTELEVANGFRQFDLCLDVINFYLQPETPFALRPSVILDFQKKAVDGIEETAGRYRNTLVSITGSVHAPPPQHLVQPLVVEMCDHINDNWHEKNAFYLSAYAMWRLNWIHPFSDGNGRTARTLSYAVLCIKLGYILPGSPTIPQQIESDKTHYIEALEKADVAARDGTTNVSALEEMIKNMLARQLLGVIEAAGGNGMNDALT